MEQAFWDGLRRIAKERGVSINALLGEIDRHRRNNLSSAIRVFVFETLTGEQRDLPAPDRLLQEGIRTPRS